MSLRSDVHLLGKQHKIDTSRHEIHEMDLPLLKTVDSTVIAQHRIRDEFVAMTSHTTGSSEAHFKVRIVDQLDDSHSEASSRSEVRAGHNSTGLSTEFRWIPGCGSRRDRTIETCRGRPSTTRSRIFREVGGGLPLAIL